MTATLTSPPPCTTSGGTKSAVPVDRLVAICAGVGVAISPSKASRIMRRYVRHVQAAPLPLPLPVWLANDLARTVTEQRRLAAELARVLWYADPTGETAINNVMNGVR